jgi:hypothetical protein
MATVYLLSEDDFDEQVYVFVLEGLLSSRVEPVPLRLRRGGGLGEVRKKLPLLLKIIQRTGSQEGMRFVVGIDNDRAVEHPTHEAKPYSKSEPCRHCGLTDAIHAEMPDGWLIPGAIAVPVQMIEAWLLLMHAPEKYRDEASLPACPWRDRPAARSVYGDDPPPQLKDLFDAERGASSKADFALECVLKLDATDLAARSPSFARLRDAVTTWPG